MKVAIYTITRNRLDLTKKSFSMLRKCAGCEFDHFVADNGSSDGTGKWLQTQEAEGRITKAYVAGQNLGQNIAANILLDWIMDADYDVIIRWDNDAIPRSKRLIKRLAKSCLAFKEAGLPTVCSPKITKLKNEPEAIGAGEDVGFKYEAVMILGGICRAHPPELFVDWRFNKYGALGFGEAMEIAGQVTSKEWGMVRLPWLEVEHSEGEDKQAEKWPEYFSFEQKEISKYVGYGL